MNDEEKFKILSFRVNEKMLAGLFAALQEINAEAIVIKGWAAARNYDRPWERAPGDIDLMVDPSAVDISKQLEGLNLGIDLHLGPRHLDTLSFHDLYDRSLAVETDGVRVRILSPEDHLRVMCVHWLTDGGERKERLWDIYWAVKNRPEGFDWDKCLNTVSAKRRRWVLCTIGMAGKHLGLKLEGIPVAAKELEVPEWLDRAVQDRWEEGVTHIPIHRTLNNRKAFIAQLKKRFPPNPVMAVIGMEGSLDARTRTHYQVGYVLKQAGPSLKRLIRMVTRGRI